MARLPPCPSRFSKRWKGLDLRPQTLISVLNARGGSNALASDLRKGVASRGEANSPEIGLLFEREPFAEDFRPSLLQVRLQLKPSRRTVFKPRPGRGTAANANIRHTIQ
jgi:hypothetical protein